MTNIQNIDLKLKSQLSAFGLNPQEWQIEVFDSASLTLSHVTDADFKLMAQVQNLTLVSLELLSSF